jgi:hypothetical protein
MKDYICPKCGLRAKTLTYWERRSKTQAKWYIEYGCPVGHKWTRSCNQPDG